MSNEQCKELERRVKRKLEEMFSGADDQGMRLELCKAVIPAVFCTLQEYSRMTEGK